MKLRLEGSRQIGKLTVRIRENHKRLPAVDLFSDVPRRPDYPLTIISPYWTPEGGKEVKLSAKSGEPMSRKKKAAE